MNDLEDRLGTDLMELAHRSPTSRLTSTDVLARVQQRHRRRTVARAMAACAVVAAVVVGVAAVASRDTDSPVGDQPGASSSADTPPLIALDAPGWRVERFDDNGQYAEYQLTNDTSHLQVSFYRGDRLEIRTAGETRETVEFNGRSASLLDYGTEGMPGNYRLDFVDGSWIWELNGDGFADRDAFLELASHVGVVDEASWKATLPANAVTSDERPAAVDALLVGIPIPAGFDAAALQSGATRDQYQLTAEVTGAVFCAWLHTWDTALDAGDNVGADAAVQAIASSHQWPALTTMTDGDWNEVLWDFADRVGGGDRAVVAQTVTGLGCPAPPGGLTTPTVP
jgi:hypothetical protein